MSSLALHVDRLAKCRSRRPGATGRTMPVSQQSKRNPTPLTQTLVRNVSLTRQRSCVSNNVFYATFELKANCMPFWNNSKQAAVSVKKKKKKSSHARILHFSSRDGRVIIRRSLFSTQNTYASPLRSTMSFSLLFALKTEAVTTTGFYSLQT
jgi:hypothetical protein